MGVVTGMTTNPSFKERGEEGGLDELGGAVVRSRLTMIAQQRNIPQGFNMGRIAKPLRGGGGGATSTNPATSGLPTPSATGQYQIPNYQNVAGGGGMANPLSRIQQEEGGGAKRRELGLI